MKSFKNLIITLVLVATIVVLLQNNEEVETRLLFASYSMPRSLLLLLTLLVGVVIGLMLRIRKPWGNK